MTDVMSTKCYLLTARRRMIFLFALNEVEVAPWSFNHGTICGNPCLPAQMTPNPPLSPDPSAPEEQLSSLPETTKNASSTARRYGTRKADKCGHYNNSRVCCTAQRSRPQCRDAVCTICGTSLGPAPPHQPHSSETNANKHLSTRICLPLVSWYVDVSCNFPTSTPRHLLQS